MCLTQFLRFLTSTVIDDVVEFNFRQLFEKQTVFCGFQSFQMSFKCHFDIDGGVEKTAWLQSPNGPGTYIECESFTVQHFLTY